MGKKSKNKDKTKRREQEPHADTSSQSRATSLPSHNNGMPLTLAPQFSITNTGTTPPLIQALQCGTRCTHGAKAADLGSIPYISTFCEEVCLDRTDSDSIYLKMVDAMKKDGLNNVPPDTIKAMFAIGTNLLLSLQYRVMPIIVMIPFLIAQLECSLSDEFATAYAFHKHQYKMDSLKKLFALYAKRIPCQCLDKFLANWKAQCSDTNAGVCQNCCKDVPDTQLAVCGRCGLYKYCSKICQREHWPEHKVDCNFLHQFKKIQQTMTP